MKQRVQNRTFKLNHNRDLHSERGETMNSKTIFKLLVPFLVLAMLLAACGGGEEPTETAAPEVTEAPEVEAPPEGEPITLQVYVVDYTAGTTDTWLENEVVPAFQEMYPNVNVEFVWGTWSTFGETVAGYFAAGDGPDIINLGSEFNGLYGDQLAPMNQYLGEAA